MLPQKRLTKRFTLIELLAVITITSMLLAIGLRVMKTDSTKANAAMHPKVISEEAFTAPSLQKAAFYADDTTIIQGAGDSKAIVC